MPFQPFHVTQWRRGVTLVGEPDYIPDDSLRTGVNVRTDRTLGAIEARPGWSQRTVSALAGGILYLARMVGTVGTFGYAQTTAAVYRLTSAWATPTAITSSAGLSAVSDANSPDGYGTVQKYLVNGSVAIKDTGATVTTMGIAPPTAPPSAVALATDLVTSINPMSSAATWTGGFLATGPTDDTTYFIEGTQSVTGTVNASTFGTMAYREASDINLDTLAGGDPLVKDDDYIHLWAFIDRPERLIYIQIDIDVDSNTTSVADAFRDNYYHVRVPSATTLNQGIATWTQLQIRKSRFVRFGTDTTRTWANARTFRIGFLTNSIGAIRFSVDDFKLRGGVGIEGEIEYTVCYRNSSTGARGNPPENSDEVVQYTSKVRTNRQRINLTISNVIQGGANHPGDTQIDRLMIWRRGGTFTQPILVDDIADTSASPFLDNFSDATLALTNTLLETDNDMPPAGSTRILFGPGGGGHLFMLVDGYRLYFSKGYERRENRAENWGRLNFAIVGDGSARAVAGLASATQVRVWTTDRTYNVVGIGQDTFLPVPMDGSHGCVGQHAVTSGDGAIYFVSQDGIYADVGGRQIKLTGAIDPFFQGTTVDGQRGWAPGAAFATHLEFLNEATGSALIMVYADSSGSSLNAFLVLKPNRENGQLTEVFFGTSALTNLSALFFDPTNRELLAGAVNGQVYRIENPDTYTDAGTGIPISGRTKSFDLGQPQHSKYISSAVIEGQTTGAVMDVTAYYDRAAIAEALGTITTTTETAQGLLASATPTTPRRDIALELTGTTTQRLAITRMGFLYEPQPELHHFIDSGIAAFDFVQQLKRLEVDIDVPVNATLTVYANGIQVHQGSLSLTAGRQNVPYPLPPGLRGRTWRITLVATTPYRCYKLGGFFKQLGTDQAYTERVMIQGV